ncbi:MAG: hypothetical protein KTR14_06350, partial [Vampirovibrio sp.]|nr:hypothetical protein [Vampirovibrio sp.]
MAFQNQSALPAMISTCKIAALCLIIFIVGLMLWVNLTVLPVIDESFFIYEGALTAEGLLPYRDIFNFYGPGTFYLVAFLVLLSGGVSLMVLRLAAFLGLVLCGWITFRIGQRFLPTTGLALLMMWLWILMIPKHLMISHHLFSTVMVLLGTYALVRFVEAPHQSKYLVWAGVCLGIATLFTLSLGVISIGFMGGGLLVYLLQNKPEGFHKPGRVFLQYFFLPVLIPGLVSVVFFAVQGALPDYLYSTVFWLFEGGYRQTTSHGYYQDGIQQLQTLWPTTFQSIGSFTGQILVLLKGLLPLLGIGWILTRLGKMLVGQKLQRLSTNEWTLWILGWSGLAFFLASFTYPTATMVVIHGWLHYLFAGVALYQTMKNVSFIQKPVWGVATLLVLSMLYQQVQAAQWQLTLPVLQSYGTVESEVRAVQYSADKVKAMQVIIDGVHALKTRPTDLFVYNASPEFYLLTNTRGPTRYSYLMPVY